VVGLGEQHVVQQLGHPPVVASDVGVTSLLHRYVDAAHRGYVPACRLGGRVGPEPSGVAFISAEVALVDRLDVVTDP